MNRHPDHLVYRWLRSMKIPVSKSFLKQQLLSHPDYPSLLSITETLDGLGIENAALVVEPERLNDIPTPFLAHIVAEGGGFIAVKSVQRLLKEIPAFRKIWDGVVVVAWKPSKWENKENEKRRASEKRQRQNFLIAGAALFLLTGYSLRIQFSWQYLIIFLITLIGLWTTTMIVQHELGINNELVDQLCAAGKNTDCNAVLHSKGSRLLSWFNLADAGIIYFSSVFLLITFSFFTGAIRLTEPVLSLVATSTLPFTFFSVYYQWRIVKKWCPFCLITVTLLWLQFIALIPGVLHLARGGWSNVSLNSILFSVFIFLIITASWIQLVKPALQFNRELTEMNFSLRRFKNSPDVFNALLRQQRKVDTTPFEKDLQLGNPRAEVQILVACNPYCGHCARAHKILHELIEKDDVGLTVRFAIKTSKEGDKRVQWLRYILQLLNNRTVEYQRKVLQDWFEQMDFEKFRSEYPVSGNEDINQLFSKHEAWSKVAGIKFTPTLFINGSELPGKYNADDLGILIKDIKKEKTAQNETVLDENDWVPL
jgi:uncharacterized membrane protein